MKKINGPTKFMIFVVLLYLAIYPFDQRFILDAFSNFLRTFIRVIPILFFVFFCMLLVNHFLSTEAIHRHLGYESGLRGWFYSIFAGILIPSPPYVVYPLLSDLKEKGMRIALIVTFLYARNLQIVFLPVMILYFGLFFTVVVSIYVFLFSIFSGILLEKIV